MLDADYVIVGSGSAGAAMAARLSEDGRHTVTVIEHGGGDRSPLIRMPAAFSYPMTMSRYDWGYRTEPEPNLGGRRLACPRGKVLGGSSSINGMVYVRGHARDFDHWAEQGATGWSFADVQAYFQRLETSHGGEEGWRGTSGPVHVWRGALANPLFRAFIAAGEEIGYGRTEDTNGRRQDGFGRLEQTIWQGQRWSAARAYLDTALKRKTVSLIQALAQRVVLEGKRAVGVEVERHGKPMVVRARREVIVAASAINSPKLLLASGIGPGDELAALGIPVVADRAGVGRNLQDHLEVYVQYACPPEVSLNTRLGLISRAGIGLRWLARRSGEGATNHFEAGAFVRSRAGIAYPDIQMHFLPAAVRYDGAAPAGRPGFQLHIGPMRSQSRGAVTLRSPDPLDAPVIRFNYMSHPDDWVEFRRAVRIAREVVAAKAFDPYRGDEMQPGPQMQSDAEIDAFVREHAESAYHPCGTCRMGRADDATAVVDPECRVIGVEGLRVADSSIMPRVTNGNLNAPSMMIGEKASDHILGRRPLPRSNAVAWVNPSWQTSDR